MKQGFSSILAIVTIAALAQAQAPWVTYGGGDGPGAGKHVVLVSGDEEYRSEEALSQLGKILATRHGFTCTVLFAIEPETGCIDPTFNRNIPGLEALAEADLMVIATRWRMLPDDQMAHIDAYLESGRPVIGLRTATHAFKPGKRSDYAHYADGYEGDKTEWTGGFGRLVIGEKWVAHHGHHKHESTRGVIAESAVDHPILRGIANGDIWGATDVYEVRLPLPGDSAPLVYGQVMARSGEFDESDVHFGMRPTDSKPVAEKNDPMMPIAWTRSYQIPGGTKGAVFTTTMGSSTDLLNEGLRRLIVNAVYWSVGLTDAIPEEGTTVDLVGEYEPTAYGFHDGDHWDNLKLEVDSFRMK